MRGWLHTVVVVAAVMCAGLPAAAGTLRRECVHIRNVHTGDDLRLCPFRARGRLDLRSWRLASRLFRSWRTGRQRTVHPRLLRVLAQIQRHFRANVIELVSGYRAPLPDDAPTSYHEVGRAADIRLPGVDKRDVLAFCRTLARVGCGYYPKATFVHVDVRGASALWVDLSAPGQLRRYVRSPRAWLRRHGAAR